MKLLLSNLDDEEDDLEEEAEALQRHGQNGLSRKDAERLSSLQAEKVQAFTIDKEKYKLVRKEAMEMSIPLIEEYDFHNDTDSPSLQIQLKPSTRVRSYQERALSRMFGNGRARSGIVVLPCGAGKTLVGITATATVKKFTLVMCSGNVAAEQWRAQYKNFAKIKDEHIVVISSKGTKLEKAKELTKLKTMKKNNEAGIVLATYVVLCRCVYDLPRSSSVFRGKYQPRMLQENISSCRKLQHLTLDHRYSMMTYKGKRADVSQRAMDIITSINFGILIMDEVHVVPANNFQRIVEVTKSHAKLGLTATLVREDDKIANLHFLIGPKLYVIIPITPCDNDLYIKQQQQIRSELDGSHGDGISGSSTMR